MSGEALMIVFIAIFSIGLLVGVPITFSLGASGVVALWLSDVAMSILVRSMLTAFESFTLLAVFLFVMMGTIYQKTGLATLVCNAIMPLIGRVKGGLALVAVYSSAFFSAFTGSATATAATISKIMGPEMVENDYPSDFSAATIAGASPLGALIPPSIVCIVLGVATGTSIISLFMMAFGISILTLVGLTVVVLYIARKNNYGGIARRYTFREGALEIGRAAPLIIVPVAVLGGMYAGMFTATEAGAIGSLISFIIAIFYRKLNLRKFFEIIIDSTGVTAMVMLIISASYVLSFVMSFTGIMAMFIDLLVYITTHGAIWGLLFLFGVLMFLGLFMDLIVMAIVLAPTAVAALSGMGVNPYHVNAVFLISNLIAIITPPVGVALFTSTVILNEKIERVSRKVIPYAAMYIIITLVIIFFPEVALWLPRMLGMNV